MNAPRVLPVLFAAILALATPALAAGPLTSGVTTSGSVSGPGYTETWTFSGTNGQRIVVAAVATSGALGTTSTLYPPGGGAAVVLTAADRWDFQLTATGTWTLEISDQGLNDAGSYVITYLNVTAGPLTHAGDTDGNAIASGEVRTGTTSGVGDLDAFTFAGTAGQRVVFAGLESSAAPYNSTLFLYPPGGGPPETYTSGGNRLDHQLLATGTYTAVVEDIANDHPGGYTVSYLNVGGGPLTTLADPDGGPIASATITPATMNGVVDLDAFTFSGAVGDRVVIVAVATSGTMNTTTYLYPPGGGAAQVLTAADRWDIQLTQAGTWTLLVEDQAFGETGTYSVAVMNLSAGPLTHAGDLDGGTIASGEVRTGTTSGVGDLDAFTFSGTAGQRVVFAGLESSGAPYNSTLFLYPPGGGAPETYTSGGNRIDHQLLATGTYTAVVEDTGNDHAGGYTVSLLNIGGGPLTTLADPDGGPIAPATIATGSMNGVVDLDAFTFSGAAGDRVVIVAVTTSGTMGTTSYLYPPGGGAAQVFTSADRWDFQLTQAGTWTLLVEDQAFGETGTYSVALMNVTAGPLTHAGDLDGGTIASGEVRTGTTSGVGDLDAFTFAGTAGQRVVFAGLESSGAPYNSTLFLYPPGGGAPETYTSGGNRIDHQLLATGTYTAVVEDIANDHPGGYTVSYLNLSGGPLTTLADPDGGPIASATITPATMNGVVDLDAFTFSGAVGDRVVIVAVATSGTMNTTTYLYPPGGGAAQVLTAADRWDIQLTQAGTWTLLVEDQAFGETGTYSVAVMNLSAGPLTHAGDLDGGAIASGESKSGTTSGPADLDAFTFSGTAGDRVVFAALTTGGGPHNTTTFIYPPGGGAPETYTSGGDHLDHQLLASGSYTVVVEDLANNDAGSWTTTFVNVTAGPVTTAGDPDGGWIASGQVRNGNVSPAPDVDVYWFNAQAGDTAIVNCFTTSGTLNTTTFLYPPGGGPAVILTAADNWSYAIPANGRWALLVQHPDLTLTGGYQLGLAGPITTVDVPGGAAAPARVAFSAPHPNPSRGEARFTLALPRRGAARLEVYDVRGALVRTIHDGALDAGTHLLAWDGRDAGGRRAPSGVYMVRARVEGAAFTRRVVRLE